MRPIKRIWNEREKLNAGVLYRMGRVVNGWPVEIRVIVPWQELHVGRDAVARRLRNARYELRCKTFSF